MQTYHHSKIVLKTNISVFTSIEFQIEYFEELLVEIKNQNDIPIHTETNDSLRNKNAADIPVSDQIRVLGKYY